MKIFIKTSSGEKIPIDVQASDTIDEIKSKALRKEHLIFQGRILSNNDTIAQCNIPENSIIDLHFETSTNYIYLKTWTGKCIPIVVDSNDTILSIKIRFQEQERVPSGQLRLIYNGKQLQDHHTLAHYNISKKSFINVVMKFHSILIFIKTWSQRMIPLEVVPSDTVHSVKMKILYSEGIQLFRQNLYYNNEKLEDNRALNDYGIQEESVICFRMQVNIITASEKTIVLDVEQKETIRNIKKKIQDLEKIPAQDQSLVYGGQYLQDSRTLEDYGIKDGCTLYSFIQIFFKTTYGPTRTLTVSPKDSIEAVKIKIQEKEGIPLAYQRLIYAGKHLLDEKTLLEYNIQKGCTIKIY